MAAAGAVSCTPPSSPPATPSSAPIESAMSESAPPGSALPSSSPEPAADLKPLLDPSPQIMRLPSGLAEVSGLAVASDRTVYAHDDEHGIVYEIDVLSGEMGAIFALGHPTIRGDFEGIATYDGLIYLITSDGLLFETQIGAHKERVPFNSYSTGIGEFCEIEGLTVKQANSIFLSGHLIKASPRRVFL